MKYLNNVSVWWHAVGTTAVVIAILAAAPSHQSARFVFQTFIDGTGVDGVGWSQRASPAYVVVIGILMAQYTLTGFDASAHVRRLMLYASFIFGAFWRFILTKSYHANIWESMS